jgi:hypothetical protein
VGVLEKLQSRTVGRGFTPRTLTCTPYYRVMSIRDLSISLGLLSVLNKVK